MGAYSVFVEYLLCAVLSLRVPPIPAFSTPFMPQVSTWFSLSAGLRRGNNGELKGKTRGSVHLSELLQ